MPHVDATGTRELPAQNYLALDPAVRAFLDELRPEEIDAMRKVVRMGPDGVDQMINAVDLARSIQRVSGFLRWLVLGLIGIVATTALLAGHIIDLWHKISPGGVPK